MKTKELIEKLSALDLEVKDGIRDNTINVFVKGSIIASINTKVPFILDIDFADTPKYMTKEIYSLLVDYASTPYTERLDKSKGFFAFVRLSISSHVLKPPYLQYIYDSMMHEIFIKSDTTKLNEYLITTLSSEEWNELGVNDSNAFFIQNTGISDWLE